MLFKKKKVIDLTELQKRGIIKTSKKEKDTPTDRQGFVDLSKTPLSSEKILNTYSDPFSFMNSQPLSQSSKNSYTKREVDRKIEELDNKIYKLEQRIELLERKLGVGTYSSY